MKIVNYVTTQWLDCACTPCAPAIMCLSPSLSGGGSPCIGAPPLPVISSIVASGAPYLDVSILSVAQSGVTCGNQAYVYTIQYDETQLIDPETPIKQSDISGLICRNCLTEYIDYKTTLILS